MNGVTTGESPWWKRTVVYQVYPRSFLDTTGNGIGDLRGIIEKLDYLEDLGVETLWLNPFFPSPQKDFGYGISDFRGVAPEYGTMGDFEELARELHERDMKVVLDITMTHTSDEHPWFVESRSSRDSPRRDWYVWRDGRGPGGRKPPNNWRAVTLGSAWHHDPATGQWYLGRYFPFHPELNFRNQDVQAAMLDILRFWMRKGVDGFRLDVIDNLFVDAEFRDNPRTWRLFSLESGNPPFQKGEMTTNLPETVEFMRVLRATTDEFPDPPRFMVGEVAAPLDVLKRYCGTFPPPSSGGGGRPKADGLHLVFLFKYLGLPLKAGKVRRALREMEEHFPEPLVPTLVFSNHDRARRISRIGNDPERAKLNVALQMTTRAVPFVYYGEELGMEQAKIPVRDALDPMVDKFRRLPQFLFELARKVSGESLNRDECRTPMQWSPGENAGFCPPGVRPWLPVPDSHAERNVESELADADSLLNCYRRFIRARRETPELNSGDMLVHDENFGHKSVLYFSRFLKAIDPGRGSRGVHVFLNFSPREVEFRPPLLDPAVVTSTNLNHLKGSGRDCAVSRLGPWEGLVLRGG
ncbi:MAG: alpha-amylase family glycosyl hydrolase [Promethearchaeota archaeon]